jgi:hypothetical protein
MGGRADRKRGSSASKARPDRNYSALAVLHSLRSPLSLLSHPPTLSPLLSSPPTLSSPTHLLTHSLSALLSSLCSPLYCSSHSRLYYSPLSTHSPLSTPRSLLLLSTHSPTHLPSPLLLYSLSTALPTLLLSALCLLTRSPADPLSRRTRVVAVSNGVENFFHKKVGVGRITDYEWRILSSGEP